MNTFQKIGVSLTISCFLYIAPRKRPRLYIFCGVTLKFYTFLKYLFSFKKTHNPVFFIKALYLQSSFSFLHKTFSVLYTCKCLPIIHAVWGLFPPPLFLLRQIPFPATLLCFEHYSHYTKNKVLYRDWACSIRNPRVTFWFFHGTYLGMNLSFFRIKVLY